MQSESEDLIEQQGRVILERTEACRNVQKHAETYSLREDTRQVVGLDLGSREWDELRDKPPSLPDKRPVSVLDSSEQHTPRRRFLYTSDSIRSVSATENAACDFLLPLFSPLRLVQTWPVT